MQSSTFRVPAALVVCLALNACVAVAGQPVAAPGQPIAAASPACRAPSARRQQVLERQHAAGEPERLARERRERRLLERIIERDVRVRVTGGSD